MMNGENQARRLAWKMAIPLPLDGMFATKTLLRIGVSFASLSLFVTSIWFQAVSQLHQDSRTTGGNEPRFVYEHLSPCWQVLTMGPKRLFIYPFSISALSTLGLQVSAGAYPCSPEAGYNLYSPPTYRRATTKTFTLTVRPMVNSD